MIENACPDINKLALKCQNVPETVAICGLLICENEIEGRGEREEVVREHKVPNNSKKWQLHRVKSDPFDPPENVLSHHPHSDEGLYLDHLLDAGCEEERGPDDGGDGQLDRQQGVHLPHEP